MLDCSARDDSVKKRINIGLIGYGFMGRAHSNAYRQVNKFFDLNHETVLKAVCGRNKDHVKAFADNWGWETIETDWRDLSEREDIDLIDICTPNNTHYEIVMETAPTGKMIACEKPLAMDVREALAMTEAVEKEGRPNMVWFNYRRNPAVTLAKEMTEEGRLGRIYHFRAKYLQDWTINPDVAQGGKTLWRLDATEAGSGVTGDLLAHCIDLALWLVGRISSVSAMTETFVKERKLQDDPGKVKPVRIDDACAFIGRFENGALATFESTRYARGRKSQNTFEINGHNGSLYWDMEEGHKLSYFDNAGDSHLRGWRDINTWDSEHPYMKHWWVPGTMIGYEHYFTHCIADFIEGIERGEKTVPDFRDGLATQEVCDSVLSSAEAQRWATIKV